MCGIAGIAADKRYQGPELQAAQARMLRAMRQRGPDDRGAEPVAFDPAATGEVWLGNTRLAILDLSAAGHQPMCDPLTGNWLVLNGEIYNHLEVRAALEPPSGGWRSGSDTETVLHAYTRWGRGCLQRLRGMFAIALWDAAEQELWCARDRLGIKPFYYRAQDELFVFASEVRALLASGLVERRLDERGLAGYVRFGSLPEPLTLLAGVVSLPAGHWLRVRAGRVVEQRQYWSPNPQPAGVSTGISESQAVRGTRQLLERAVREHLLSDVPVASFLSGGIDSSIVTALAAQSSPTPIKTFTVGFRESGFDESEYAQAVATRYRTDHQRILLDGGEVAGLVSRAVRAMDQPSADGVNTYVVAGAVAERGIKVVLSGLGGDELFGGYRGFQLLPRAEKWAPVIGTIPKALRSWAAGGGRTGARVAEMTGAGLSLADRYDSLRAQWSSRELLAIGLDPQVSYAVDDLPAQLAEETQVSLLELQGYMRGTLLRDGDVMSMAHSLEMRVPLLDHELVEYCLANGAAVYGQKRLLLRAAGELLPPGIADRPKQGFVFPLDCWMRGPLRGFVSEGLARLTQTGVLPKIQAGELHRQFETGRLQWSRLWTLVVLGHWVSEHLSQAGRLVQNKEEVAR